MVLTTSAILANTEGLFAQAPELRKLRWVATDEVAGGLAQEWRDPGVTSNTLALLQYTSGSTAEPKGVEISHGNLLHNSAYISRLFAFNTNGVTVIWLPAFHDMGLTNGIIQPVYHGRPCYLMPAVAFLMQPIRWLQAISRYKATISGGPNFAYELCTRRITPNNVKLSTSAVGMWLTTAPSRSAPTPCNGLRRPLPRAVSAPAPCIHVMDSPKRRCWFPAAP